MFGLTALFLFHVLFWRGQAETTTTEDITAQTVDPTCSAPWNVTVSPELEVKWSGINRTGDVFILLKPIDPPNGTKCISTSQESTYQFNEYEQTLPPTMTPCRGTRYSVRVKLICDGSADQVRVTKVTIPPEDLTSIKNVQLVNVTNETLEIQWDALKIHGRTDILYTVHWNTVDDAVHFEEANTSTTSHIILKLKPYTQYSIKVRANSGQDTGNWSDILVNRTNSGVPSVPRNVTVIRESTSIEIHWLEPDPFQGPVIFYTVFWRLKKEPGNYNELNTSSSYHIITGLIPLTFYFIRVSAATEAGRGNYSEITATRTRRPVAPEKIRYSAITSRSIELAWTEPSLYFGRGLIVAYSLEWTNLDTNENRTNYTRELTYKIENLLPLTNYSIRVRAWTGKGPGEWSPHQVIQTEIGSPDAPENLRHFLITSRSIEVAWDEPFLYFGRGLIVAYSVEWTNLESYENRTENTTELTYKIDYLRPFTNYSIRVQAWTELDGGDWSTYIVAQTEIGIPDAPENLRTAVTSRSIEVSWDEQTLYAGRGLILAYHVYWIRLATNDERMESTVNLTYKMEGLVHFTNYSIRVRAKTLDGTGNWTAFLVVQTKVGVPPVPGNVRQGNVTASSIEILWDVKKEYQLLVTHHSVRWWKIGWRSGKSGKLDNATAPKFVLEKLDAFANYSFSVRSWTSDGAGNWSVPLVIETAIGVPAVPRNISFNDIQQTSMGVAWEEPEPYRGPITSYAVQWATSDWNLVYTNVTTDTNFVLQNLSPYTVYWVKVNASSFAGAGPWSESLEQRTKIGIPSIPRNLKEIEATNKTIKVQWEEPRPSNGPIKNYTVRWTNLNSGLVVNDTTKALSYLIQDLPPFTNHSIEVCATTEAGTGEWSDSAVIRTNVGVPSEPKGLKARRTTDTSIELAWEEPEPVVGIIEYYAVQWNNTVTGQKRKWKSYNTYFTIKDLDPHTEYSVRVRAVSSAGQGNWTEPEIFRTSSGVPGSPLHVHKVNTTNCTIHIQWEEPKPFQGPIISYLVRWTHNISLDTWTNNTASLEYTLEGLDPYTSYKIFVKAKTDAGFGPESNAITVQTDIGIPTVPRHLTMTNKTAWSIEITWSTPNSLNGPLMNYAINWGTSGVEMYRNFTNSTLFEVDGLIPYTKYSFQVSASTEVGYGPQTDPLTLRTDIAIPNEPLHLELESSSSTSLSVKWKEPWPSYGPILGYYIQWFKLGEALESTNETKLTAFSIFDLDPYTNYSIKISARTSAGVGDWCEPFVASTTTGVPKPAMLQTIKVMSSRSIQVEWDSIPPYPGPTDYILEVWQKPGQCSGSVGDSQQKRLRGNKGKEEWNMMRTDRVEDLMPYTEYYVKVLMETERGRSESEKSAVVRTSSESPEAPTQVLADCNSSSTEVEVRWNPPERANGKIVEYRILYGLVSFGYMSRSLSASSQCGEHRVLIQGLRPEKQYRIYVQAVVEDISEPGEKRFLKDNCVLPAGVPPMGKVQEMNAKKGSSCYQLTFEWSRQAFSDYMGLLVNYAVLVGESDSVGNSTSGRSVDDSPSWINFTAGMSSYYQATPVEWKPTDESDPLKCEAFNTERGVEIIPMLRCTLGLKSQCSSEERYCNGPLKPETKYGLKIRGFTRGGYSEIGPMYAETGAVPGSSVVGGLVGGFLFLLLVSAFIAGTFILKRKGKLDELRMTVLARFRPHLPAPQPAPEQVLQLEPYSAVQNMTAVNFAEHVRIMMSDSHLRFSQEFEALKLNSPKFTCSTAEMQENRSKNRWLNIFPYDHSRVKLLPLGDDPASDFINANYIPGTSSLREYIACQGPLNTTVDDMWRMVWEQNSTMVVMLTQCVERGKSKCEQYWPSPAGETLHYGDLAVRTLSESMLTSFVIRVFHVQLGSQSRLVKQLHFTQWPDFGCPESPEHLINFIRAMRDHVPRIRPGPIVVHCSAGVGRTGTFIAVDRISQQLQQHIDIYGTVLELRHHRVNMVQTEDQYIYIHLCVKQLLEDLENPTESEYEEAIYSNIGMEKDTGF